MNVKLLNIKSIFGVAFFSLALLLTGCDSETNTENVEDAIEDLIEEDDELGNDFSKSKQVFYSLPSPIETAMLMKRAGAKYNEDYLNSIDKLSDYSTTKSMSLNLGVYSADLSFSSMFDQSQASIKYLAATKKMAEALGILNAVDKSTIKRMESNVNNRDSLMEIISETFMNSNSFLKENDRAEVAAMILLGGWIEGLYVATQIAKTTSSNKELVERIVDQRLSLNTLASLLGEYKDDENIAELITELSSIQAVFDKIEVSSSKIEVVSSSDSKVTTLKTSTKTTITDEIFEELCDKVETFRNNIVK